MFKIRFPTRPACNYLHADTGLCTSFYSGSFALYLKMFMHLLKTANIMFLSFIRFELLSFEDGNPLLHKM